ncbi:hypothetical protein HEQ72_10580 [Haematospirillum sp. 15-248]|uniref:hypothetical protein n=1 Tax=Haematospirillum sp. 15-248 TaxID=2723107 RepID=UPI00143AA0DD|nr:hypothetical protein [Haematospirillum sp. 15-248]NKD88746.1 hypothetical protein [Haematospirillum sp. 15-248]
MMGGSETDNIPDLSLPEWSGVWSNHLEITKLITPLKRGDRPDTLLFTRNPKMKVPPELDGIGLAVLFNSQHITFPYDGKFVTIGYMGDKTAVLLWEHSVDRLPHPLSLRLASDGEQRLLKKHGPA